MQIVVNKRCGQIGVITWSIYHHSVFVPQMIERKNEQQAKHNTCNCHTAVTFIKWFIQFKIVLLCKESYFSLII